MKKAIYILVPISIILFMISIAIYKNFIPYDIMSDNKSKKIMTTNMISMMYETSANSGIYETIKDNKWPTSGYIFNETLSKCENGSDLYWDDSTKKVIMSGSMSDKCYVYFDKRITNISSVCSEGENIALCIKELSDTFGSYATNIYHHDSSLTDGASDNSYRYAGAEEFLKLTDKGNYDQIVAASIVGAENSLIKYKLWDDELRFVNEILGYDTIEELFSDYDCETMQCAAEHDGYETIQEWFFDFGGFDYILAYDTAETRYLSYESAENKAFNEGYLEIGAINNYVCFGSNDAVCDDENLYRIIGVFDSAIVSDNTPTGNTEPRVKLIKAYEGTETSLGTNPNGNAYKNTKYYKGKLDLIPGYYWSGSSSMLSNSWTASTFNTSILNGTYLTTLGETWTDKIATTQWKIGGNTENNTYNAKPSVAYSNEIVNPATNIISNPNYNAKIGLMYASDFGFAASPLYWNTRLIRYLDLMNIRYSGNWLFMGINEWTISPNSDDSRYTVMVGANNYVSRNFATSTYGVRPTFYLNSNVKYIGGQGTPENPYRIS